MKTIRVSLKELQQDPIAAFRRGNGQPVGIEKDGVVLFFLASAIDIHDFHQQPNQSSIAPEKPVSEAALPVGSGKVSLNAAAKLVGKSKSTISRYISSNRLSAEEQGNAFLISVEELALVFNRQDILKKPD